MSAFSDLLPLPPDRPRGRWAPSPTGLHHVGNARTALAAWLSVRSRGGAFVWRLEDLDAPRVVEGTAEAAQEDLAWLGLDWDEGPDLGGPHAPYAQGQRSNLYELALLHLYEGDHLFPCGLSRREVEEAASAPHTAATPYPIELRPTELAPDWYEDFCDQEASQRRPGDALRFRVTDVPVRFHDLVLGDTAEHTRQAVGDFVLKRRDGLYAYQLAVVVDDLLMGVNEVVRGEELLSSTARQLLLIEALGGPAPRFAHVPMVVTTQGKKLSKRDGGLTLRSLREAGVRPEALAGYLGHTLGLLPEPAPVPAADLVARFAWDRVPKEKLVLPDDLTERLRRL